MMNKGRNYMDRLLGRNEGRESRDFTEGRRYGEGETFYEDEFSDSGENARGERSQTSRSVPRPSFYKSDAERDFNTRFGSRPESDRGNSSLAPRGGFFGKGPKGYQRSDERIREEVCEALYRDYHVDASEVEVDVKEGIVTLSGTVDSRQSKRAAEQCVENLTGVSDVHNRVRIAEKGNISNLRKENDSGEKRALS